jgi:hypothetical protein
MATTIRDIQFTTNANGNSPLMGQSVTVQGIVTGTGYIGGKYTIADAAGAWNAVMVNDPAHNPNVGDEISITGTVAEASQFTEIGSIASYTLIDTGNAIPAITAVTPTNLTSANGEQYESVLVRLSNVRVSIAPIDNRFYVALVGSTTNSTIQNSFFPQPHTWSGISVGQMWTSISGIVSHTTGSYQLNPRGDADMVPLADPTTISMGIEDVEAAKGETKSVTVKVSMLQESWNIKKYVIKLGFNKRILSFVDADIVSTLTPDMPEITLSDNQDSVTIVYDGDSAIVSEYNNQALIKLLFHTESYGESVLDLTQAVLNDTAAVASITDGRIRIPIKKSMAWLSIYNDNYNKKNIFNPWLAQKITIEYGSLVQAGVVNSKAIVRIYDVQGRLVATPVNKVMSASIETIPGGWDGKDSNRVLLPIGLYYCHLEVIDRVTGKSETTVQPIVIAAELK